MVRAASSSLLPSSASVAEDFNRWLQMSGYPAASRDSLALTSSQEQGRNLIVTSGSSFSPGDNIFNIPENFTVTALDVANHPVLGPATSAVSNDLALLATWLLWESSQGEASSWAPYVRTFTVPELSPLLWSQEERLSLLQGYSGLKEIESRIQEIDGFYDSISSALLSANSDFAKQTSEFSPDKFRKAFVSILSRAIYLPEAGIFALIPLADFVRHSLSSTNTFQYDSARQAVVLLADKSIKPGQEILACRTPELPNFDSALQTGEAFLSNPHDFVSFTTGLVPGDPLLLIKKQILQEEGFTESATFPLFADRFPRQLLSYLRLARVQDAAQFAKVTFKADVMVSESNEYEVLMLVLNDCKERLQAYPQPLEDDIRILRAKGSSSSQGPGLFQSFGVVTGAAKTKAVSSEDTKDQKERLAAQLRASEKVILNSTVTALRNRLAPIRGVPTKSGMGDPNAEIKEVFGMMEAGLSAPTKILADIFKKQK